MKLEKMNDGFYQIRCGGEDNMQVFNREQLFDLYCQIDDILEEERELKKNSKVSSKE